jgi:hypothetical protein
MLIRYPKMCAVFFLTLSTLAGCQQTEEEKTCSADAECAEVFSSLGVCEQAQCLEGACIKTSKANGTSCDDGNACTSATACQSGVCTGGTNTCQCTSASDCSSVLTLGVCEQAACENRQCRKVNKSDGVTCDDGNNCTSDTLCQSGTCGGGANTCQCSTASDCSSVLTLGVCEEAACQSNQCVKVNKSNGSSCNDGNACTVSDACNAGTCTGTAIVVSSSDASSAWSGAFERTCRSCHSSGELSKSSQFNRVNLPPSNGSHMPRNRCDNPTSFAADTSGNCLTLSEYCALRSLAGQ